MAFNPDACCSICAYFEGEDKEGSCRRRAPQPAPLHGSSAINGRTLKGPGSVWPSVRREDWCGDFELRRSDSGCGVLHRSAKMLIKGINQVDQWESSLRARMRQRAAASAETDA